MALSSPRAAIMAVFAAFGALVGTFAGSAPLIINDYGLNNVSYGIGVTAMTAATVAAMAIAGWLAHRVSHRHILLVILPAAYILLTLLALGGIPGIFFPAIMFYGFALGLLDVFMNAEGGQIEVLLGKPVYTAFHGAASLGTAIFAIASSFISVRFGLYATLLAASLPVAFAIVLVWKNISHKRLDTITPETDHKPGPRRQITLPLALIGVAAGIVIASEMAALFWSAELLAGIAPELAAVSGLGAAFFSLCNALVRFPGDLLRARISDFTLMSTSALVAIAGFTGLALTSGFAANVFFFALTGLGVALICPCLFAMAANQSPKNRAAGLGIAMLIAGAPRIIAPVAFGAIADAFSIRIAFGLCAAMLLVAFYVVRSLASHKRRTACL